MHSIKETVKIFLNNFSKKFSVVEPITDKEDYIRAKKWTKKATKTFKKCVIFWAILAIVISIVCHIELKAVGIDGFLLGILTFLLSIIYLGTFTLAGLGRATMKMHFKEVRKTAWEAAKFGYSIGKEIKTEHIDITHEYTNTYRVSSRTEHKGLLFAIICMLAIMGAWSAYCVYKGCFLELKKLIKTKEELKNYKNSITV